MLEISITVLLIVWLLGLMSAYTLNGAIHVCLFLALLFIAIRVIRRRAEPTMRDPRQQRVTQRSGFDRQRRA